jgi:hypothetical protein
MPAAVDGMTVPSILYLYLPAPPKAQTDDLLASGRFKVSRPSNLNDPFDLIPAMTPDAPADHIRKFLEWNAPLHGHHGPITPQMIAELKARTDRESQNTNFDRKELLTRTRLLCLTSRNDGVMMWSHYASRHTGFVVGFKSDILSRLSPPCSFFEVTYGERPICTPLDFINRGQSYGLAEKVFSVKSEEWKYEQEWRCLFGHQQLRGSDYLNFPPEAIECVILGSLISTETEELLEKACRLGGILEDAIELKRAHLSPQKFAIEIRPTTWHAPRE